MADENKKKKNKKGKKNPKKVLEDALKGAPSVEEKTDSIVAGGDQLPSPDAVEPPRGYEECVFSMQGTGQSEGSAAAAKYDEMKFSEEGKKEGVNHAYNEITFHQPGSAVPVPKVDPLVHVNRGHLSSSASYEVPSPTGLNPAPTSGFYMSLHRQKEEEPEYEVGISKVKRLVGSVTRRFSSRRARTDSAGASSKFGTMKWSLVLVVVSVCVALVSILLSIAALSLSTKCATCPQLREELNAVQQTQLRAMNCTYELVDTCTFSSGSEAFCETVPVRFSETTPVARSLGCVVTPAVASPENAFVATLIGHPGEGYHCQCYQTGNTTDSSEVGCSLGASVQFVQYWTLQRFCT